MGTNRKSNDYKENILCFPKIYCVLVESNFCIAVNAATANLEKAQDLVKKAQVRFIPI